MKTLGFRAEPECINWAVTEGACEAPILVGADKAKAPKDYTEAETLSWVRNRCIYLIEEYLPDVIAVRYPEPIGSGRTDSARKRCRVEGVILEAANSKGLKVVTGALTTISKNLGSQAKKYLDNPDLRGLDWQQHPQYVREAILVAASILE